MCLSSFIDFEYLLIHLKQFCKYLKHSLYLYDVCNIYLCIKQI